MGLDRGGVWKRAWRDAAESWRGVLVGALLLGMGAAIAGALVPSGEPWEGRAAIAVGLFLGAVLAIAVVVFLVRVMNAPVIQRDEARSCVDELEAEIARRDEIRFSLEATVEVLAEPHPWHIVLGDGAPVPFTRNVALWVRLTNVGPTADFVAQLLNVSGLPDRAGNVIIGGSVDEVAWEHTIEPLKTVAQGGRARLFVGNYARAPEGIQGIPLAPCFWFWTSRSATWSPDSHAAGWKYFGDQITDATVEFDLVVADTTHGQSRIQHARIVFGDPGEPPEFTFCGDLRVFDPERNQ